MVVALAFVKAQPAVLTVELTSRNPLEMLTKGRRPEGIMFIRQPGPCVGAVHSISGFCLAGKSVRVGQASVQILAPSHVTGSLPDGVQFPVHVAVTLFAKLSDIGGGERKLLDARDTSPATNTASGKELEGHGMSLENVLGKWLDLREDILMVVLEASQPKFCSRSSILAGGLQRGSVCLVISVCLHAGEDRYPFTVTVVTRQRNGELLVLVYHYTLVRV